MDTVLFQQLLKATQDGQSLFLTKVQYEPFLVQGLAEINQSSMVADGSAATRLTQAGLQYATTNAITATATQSAEQAWASSTVTTPAGAPATVTPIKKEHKPRVHHPRVDESFIVEDKALAAKERKAFLNTPKYPFEQLNVGQSFFVPNTEFRPEAVKTMQSAVTSANNRFAEKTGEKRINRGGKEVDVLKLVRKFDVRAETVTGADGKEISGARVGRIA